MTHTVQQAGVAAPKKRGRKAAAVAAPNKEEEETEKKPGSKRGRKAVICLCLSPFMVLVNCLISSITQEMQIGLLIPDLVRE